MAAVAVMARLFGGFFGGFWCFFGGFWWDVTQYGTSVLFLILKLSKPVRATISIFRTADCRSEMDKK
jgi:uncharacterized membrane protein